MNKNNKNKRESDDIITKKGFLISLPGKNKTSEKSSINMAKTISSESSINMGKPKNNDKKDGGKQSFDNKNKNNNTKLNSQDGEQKAAVGNDNRDNHDNRRNDRRDRFNKKKKHGFNDNKANDNRHDNQKNNNTNYDRNESLSNNDRQESVKKGQDRNDRHFDNRNERRRQQKNNHRDFKNDNRHENKNIEKNTNDKVRVDVENNKKNPSITPLSTLSGEFSGFGKNRAVYNNVTVETTSENNISLEEKYKNAVPLAQQIAEETAKARHHLSSNEETEKKEIIGVRFREAGKIYYFDPCGMTVPFGAPVIVETARGDEYGFTAISNRKIPAVSLVAELKKVVRLATQDDTRKYEANKTLEKDAAKIFKEKVEKLGLEMNLIYVEYTFDNSKLLFYFTAESRVDFRELVKELAGIFKTRIELRQIGVRDEAKVLGGMGVCGRATCCSTFLGDFAQVSIKMAKDQSLSLNAAKISGACGKLMCCLRYEDKVYEQENARTPKVGALVETPEGRGTVTERNTLKGTVKVAIESQEEAPPKLFSRDEVRFIGKGTSENDVENDSADEIKDEE